FEQHVKTARGRRGLPMLDAWYERPVFYFSNHRSLIAGGEAVHAPTGCEWLDYELEIGCVIGRDVTNVTEDGALDAVLGFTIVNDFSARDLQRAEMAVGLGPAKGKDFATAVGPAVVPIGELGDCIDGEGRLHLEMTASVNGKKLSKGNAGSIHFTWPQIIEFAGRDVELKRGDLLGSGTVGTGCILELGPEQVGGWLKPGDTVELEIERLGKLTTPIVRKD
ncbi:MAG: fumarylacetoacetate hydrolase family protein, partial [Planctomycetota bacterium]